MQPLGCATIATVQLQSVPGEPDRPAEVAAAALAARGIVLVNGRLTGDTVATVTARALTHDGDRPLEVHLTNVTGSLRRALLLHDLLAGLDPRPRVVASGQLDTAGALLLAAAAAGERALTVHASIHLTRVDPATISDDEDEMAHLRLDVESAAAETETIKRHVEEILGRLLDRPALYRADEAVIAGLADKIR